MSGGKVFEAVSEFVVTLITANMVLSLVMFPLHIAMIVMGAKYKDECPVEDMIPIYLIVGGSLGLFSICCLGDVKYTCCGNEETANPFIANGLMQLLLFAWFIAGNVWIYKNYEPNYADPSSPDFCHKTLYLFAFWVTNSHYILFGGVFGIMCLKGFGTPCQTNQSEV